MSEPFKALFSSVKPQEPDTSREDALIEERKQAAEREEQATRKRAKAKATAATGGSRWKLFFGNTGEAGVTTTGKRKTLG